MRQITKRNYNQNIIYIKENEFEFFDNFSKKNNINWSEEHKENSIITLNNSLVGYIVTPERKINLLPKYDEVDFEHIFRMYLYIYSYKPTESPRILDISKNQNDLDIAELFFEQLSKNMQLGIIQEYKKKQQELKIVKGKVDYIKTYKKNMINKKNIVYSKVSKLSLNNQINKMIVTALNKLQFINEYSVQARKYLTYFENVDLISENGSEYLKQIKFNSNTSRYRQTLLYASMIIDKLDYENTGSSVGTESFLLNFDKLFEEFIGEILTKVPREREFSIWTKGEEFGSIKDFGVTKEKKFFLPDILFKYLKEDEKFNYASSSFAVIDVKNKAYSTFKNSDIYQIITYARLLHSQKMILIYPSFFKKYPEILSLDSEIFSPSIISGIFVNVCGESGDEFLEDINFFVSMMEKTLFNIFIKK
ncbi:conserved hypothetical protein [Brochothrix thermosphacta]|uniref:5-methylcytosine restriction system specificity protein McrC n=1 Tax=Brochothrix thermosphacta TaxID=2756 RepID=UPI000D794BF1|nr:hypothetical protein [Brochothrix thermosphacta]SPP28936.1 conserved hypothetical protein [Brochothrix thermosphacta]